MAVTPTTPPQRPPLQTLTGQQVVFLGHQRWNTHITPTHHITNLLARENKVLFIEPPESLAWLFHEPPAREALTWALNPLEKLHENLYVYHTPPLFLPYAARARWISKTVTATQKRWVLQAMRQLGFERPVCWVFQFNSAEFIHDLNPKLTVYECAEDYAAYEVRPWVRKYVEDFDAQICKEADCVIVPSENMEKLRGWVGDRLYRIPWGVDVPHYAQAYADETPVPPEIDKLPRPIIGLVGMLDGRRMHYDLLLHMARKHRDWSIALVGRCMPNLNKDLLNAEPNIHFFGMQPIDKLPGFCKAFDVCMIPYVINRFTEAIMPLKLVEYLATGKPCVSTHLPATEPFKDLIAVADTVERFEQHVINYLEHDPNRDERIACANAYSWEVIGAQRLAIAAETLARKAAAERGEDVTEEDR